MSGVTVYIHKLLFESFVYHVAILPNEVMIARKETDFLHFLEFLGLGIPTDLGDPITIEKLKNKYPELENIDFEEIIKN